MRRRCALAFRRRGHGVNHDDCTRNNQRTCGIKDSDAAPRHTEKKRQHPCKDKLEEVDDAYRLAPQMPHRMV